MTRALMTLRLFRGLEDSKAIGSMPGIALHKATPLQHEQSRFVADPICLGIGTRRADELFEFMTDRPQGM